MPDNKADNKQDELDRSLDAALAKYTAVEPRPGLEARILASLRAEPARVPDRAWWQWSLVAAAAVVIVALALAWRSGKPSRPVVANRSSTATPAAKEPATQVALGGAAGEHHSEASTSANRWTANQVRRETVAAANRLDPPKPEQPRSDQPKSDQPKLDQPKLDQFPSPQPLSDQEKILQSYVAEYPEQAVMIARARSEALQRDLEQMKALPSRDGAGDSEESTNGTTER